MSRKVFISSKISIDPRLNAVAMEHPDSVLLWPWLLTAFDDWGRAEAHPLQLKASVFPMLESVTTELIADTLERFAAVGLLGLYTVGNQRYMAIAPAKWFGYQTHIRREKRERDESKIPAPPPELFAHMREDAREVAQDSENSRICVPSPSPSPSSDTTTATREPEEAVRRQLVDGWTTHMRVTISPFELDTLAGFIFPQDTSVPPMDPAVVVDAMREAAAHGARTMQYLTRILENRVLNGLTTMEAVQNHETEWQQRHAAVETRTGTAGKDAYEVALAEADRWEGGMT